jgi:hypothetical protein
MKKSEAFDSSLKKVFDECCEGEEWNDEFDNRFNFLNWSTPNKNGIDAIKSFISSLLAKQQEELNKNIDQLRQWLNEDRIDDFKKMITNDDIKFWLNIK